MVSLLPAIQIILTLSQSAHFNESHNLSAMRGLGAFSGNDALHSPRPIHLNIQNFITMNRLVLPNIYNHRSPFEICDTYLHYTLKQLLNSCKSRGGGGCQPIKQALKTLSFSPIHFFAIRPYPSSFQAPPRQFSGGPPASFLAHIVIGDNNRLQ